MPHLEQMDDFLEESSLPHFKHPTLYHWFLALSKTSVLRTYPIRWQNHFNSLGPILKEFGMSFLDIAAFIHNRWNTPLVTAEIDFQDFSNV